MMVSEEKPLGMETERFLVMFLPKQHLSITEKYNICVFSSISKRRLGILTKILAFVTPLNLLNVGGQPLCFSWTPVLLYRDMHVCIPRKTSGRYEHRQTGQQKSAFMKGMKVQTILHWKHSMGQIKKSWNSKGNGIDLEGMSG